MKQKIAVIGAGVSGLSAGIHAALKGFGVDIFESHDLAGGQCTAWRRKGYDIDGCIHWLSGTRPGTSLRRVWELCGALSGDTEVVNHEHITSYMDDDGNIHHLYRDLRRMEEQLFRISPEDRKEITFLVRTIRAFRRMPQHPDKPMEIMSPADRLKYALPMMRSGKAMKFGMQITIPEYIGRFRSPVVRHLLKAVCPPVASASSLFYTLACAAAGDGGWPMGGSLRMAQRMQRRFEELGGTIFFRSPVKKIVTEEGKAVGIRLHGEDEVRRYDYVIPAVDANEMLRKLLDDEYDVPYFTQRFADPQKYPVISATIISIGVETDLSHRPHTLCFQPSRKVVVGDAEQPLVIADHYCYDPAFSSGGKSLVEFLFSGFTYDYWKQLRDSSEEGYRSEKKRLGEALLAELQGIYPETQGKAQVIDVATPLTFDRYCNAYKGAYMSFLSTAGVKYEDHKGIIPDIENLYLAGQWVFMNGGLPGAVMAGKYAVQRICSRKGISIKF